MLAIFSDLKQYQTGTPASPNGGIGLGVVFNDRKQDSFDFDDDDDDKW